jgi:hypothetical protein
MKRSIVISAAAVLIAVTGCKYDYTSESTWGMLTSFEETTGSDVRLTTYAYNNGGDPTGERQTLNGVAVYEDTDFEYTSNHTRTNYRTVYGEDGVSVASRQRRVSSYTDNWAVEYKFELFELGADGSETDPVERWEGTYDSSGLPSHYESEKDGYLTERVDYMFGSSIIKYTQIEFNEDTPDDKIVKTVTETYLKWEYEYRYLGEVETKIGDDIVEYQINKYITLNTGGYLLVAYKKYVGGSETSDPQGILVEEMRDYKQSSDGLIRTWSVLKYDAEGNNPTTTTFKQTYEFVTLRF